MELYSAKQVAEILARDDAHMNLRTVRYYTQLGLIPPLELVGNRRGYTDVHLDYFRAIMALSRSGETLAAIEQRLAGLSPDEVARIGDSLPMLQPQRLIDNETHVIGEDVVLSMSPRLPAELRSKMVEAVSKMVREQPHD